MKSETYDSFGVNTKNSFNTPPKNQMKNTLHKGPFPLHTTKNDDAFVIITNHGTHYAKTYDPSAARLISAAPDLLETLQDICAMIVSPNDTRADILAHAQKAIAKANGEV